MPSLRFFVSPRTRAIHTWITKHLITSEIQNGSMNLVLGWACRWSPRSSAHLRTCWSQVFLLKYSALIVIFHAFFYLFFASLPFASHDVVCLANVKEQFCHSAFKECAEVNGTFVPALIWSVQVHFCWILSVLFVHLNYKDHYYLHFFSVGSFCSRSECEKRKAIWDACVAEIKQDPGQKNDFDSQMLAVMNTTGQYTQTDWSVSFVWSPASFLAYL